MIETPDNPFASPQVVATAISTDLTVQVSAWVWFKSPALAGFFYGGLIGLAVFGILMFRVVVLERNVPPAWFFVPMALIGGAMLGSLLGAVSGALVGLIAALVRLAEWRSRVHLLSCLILSPVCLTGPLVVMGITLEAYDRWRFLLFLGMTLVGGILHGVLLFRRLRRVTQRAAEKTESPTGEQFDGNA
ncbi:hypothetical protein [Blastopirellula marina]|nr:hypothetical protein [Blastopirellula marina]